jgi:ketosteroid isomerase-like protein
MGRHLDERLALRAPGLYRRFLKVVFALPTGSPLRRRVLKRLVARGCEALSREDDEVVLLAYDDAAELNVISDELRALGFAERYHGHQGWRDWLQLWRAGWVSARYAPEAVIDLGDRLGVRIMLTSRGASSGAEVTQTTGYIFYTVDGAIMRQDFYMEWSECVEALGLDAIASRVSA